MSRDTRANAECLLLDISNKRLVSTQRTLDWCEHFVCYVFC